MPAVKAMAASGSAQVPDVFTHLLNISPLKATPGVSAAPRDYESPPELRKYKLKARYLESPSPEPETESKAPKRKAGRTVETAPDGEGEPSTPKAKAAAVQTKAKQTSKAKAKSKSAPEAEAKDDAAPPTPEAKPAAVQTKKAKRASTKAKAKCKSAPEAANAEDDAAAPRTPPAAVQTKAKKTSKAAAKDKKPKDGVQAKPKKKADDAVAQTKSSKKVNAEVEVGGAAAAGAEVQVGGARAADADVEVDGTTAVDGIKVTVIKTADVPDDIAQLGSPENIFDHYTAIVFKGDLAEGARVLGLTIDRANFAETHLDALKAVALGREILKITASAGEIRVRVKVEYRAKLGISFNVKFLQGAAVKQATSHYIKGTDQRIQVDALIQHALGWRAFVLSLTHCEALELTAVTSFAVHVKDYCSFFLLSDTEGQ